MSVTGLPGQGPVRAGIPVADLSTGLLLANGILIALLERQTSGQGQWIQTSLLAAQIFMLDLQAVRYLIDGDIPEQAGNNHPTTIPTGTYRTSNGHINIAASTQDEFQRLCQVLQLEHILIDPDYMTRESRSINRTKLNQELESILLQHTSEYWIEKLNQLNIACGPINRIDQMFADPQVEHLQLTTRIEHHRRGSIDLIGQPISMSRSVSSVRRQAPYYAEHTRDILQDLGYESNHIDDLVSRHVVYVSSSSIQR
jgi:crotonobetainyl-CoA:carnitine CoA-transferase CaiB-like acyl-CoA transferase